MFAALAQVGPSTELVDVCGSSPSWACRRIFDATGNKGLAGAIDYVVGAPLRIIVVLIVTVVVNHLIHRAIRKFTNTISGAAEGRTRLHAPAMLLPTNGSLRAAARAQTIGSVLR